MTGIPPGLCSCYHAPDQHRPRTPVTPTQSIRPGCTKYRGGVRCPCIWDGQLPSFDPNPLTAVHIGRGGLTVTGTPWCGAVAPPGLGLVRGGIVSVTCEECFRAELAYNSPLGKEIDPLEA
jgi:hypothetical protein